MNRFKPAIVEREQIRRQFVGKKILILGIGVLGGGSGAAKFFADLGAKVTATDLKTAAELDKHTLQKLTDQGVRLTLGRHRRQDILAADLIIRNPGVPLNSPYLKLALAHQIPVTMEAALFARLCPVPIIGITGSRGKTTTTHMLAAILQAANFHTIIGGNIQGKSTLPLLWQVHPATKVVLELSSWALQGFAWEKISPQISLITNIYPDHLNRYSSMDEYIADKTRIFQYQRATDYLFLNRETPEAKTFADTAPAEVRYFANKDLPDGLKLKVPGAHNRSNAAAARSIGRLLGIADKIIKPALQNFPGVPYRLQPIRRIKGIVFINDTTSTTPIATVTALRTYRNQPIVLIIGGAAKNLPLDKLVAELKQSSVKQYIFLAGNGTEILLKQLQERKIIRQKPFIFNNLKAAVQNAYRQAAAGDIVLFSPAFTSFAMFKNEFHRGDEFNRVVRQL